MAAQSAQQKRGHHEVALVLSGAGSRGAFEAGVLSVLLPKMTGEEIPRIIVGTSAGALNAALLARYLDQGPDVAAAKLVDAWRYLGPEQVFRRPLGGLLRAGAWHIHHKPGVASALLDTTRLEETIGLLTAGFQSNLGGCVKAMAVVASSCSKNRAVVFVDGYPAPSGGASLDYVQAHLDVAHLVASSAFPMAFPPKWISDPQTGASDWYIDGGVHLNTPLKPAIDLTADRILVVGGTPSTGFGVASPDVSPDVMDAGGQLLHAFNVDKMIADLATLDRTNRSVTDLKRAGGTPTHRYVKKFVVIPTDDSLCKVAAAVWPSGLTRLVTGFGGYRMLGPLLRQRQQHGDVLSYLCFHPDFICEAIALGRKEAMLALGGNQRIPWK